MDKKDNSHLILKLVNDYFKNKDLVLDYRKSIQIEDYVTNCLIIAVFLNRLNLFRYFVSMDVDLNYSDSYDNSCLYYICILNKRKMFETISKKRYLNKVDVLNKLENMKIENNDTTELLKKSI